ncbi:sugar-transfer associated ATP-grasp domain-containing protein, partial [Cetobacterium sp.]|uniref:sugar-transfer associated ATP-grasp domain-containing protein n=1 Tax=Cetobacterium sp. TaxID=2071632 RepID=UPI002FC92F92
MLINLVKNIKKNIDKYKLKKKIKILKRKSKKKLTVKEKNEIVKFYSKYNLTPSVDWHEYYKYYIDFNKKNIPEDLFYLFIEQKLNNKKQAFSYEDKNMYSKIYKSFKMPKSYLRNINGKYLNENYERTNYIEIIENLKNGEYILKKTLETSGGKDVFSFYKKENEYYNLKNGEKINIDKKILEFKKNFILQEKIEQSFTTSKFHQNSLNTIRIISYRGENNKVNILSAVLRIGSNGSIVDNPYTSGGFTVGIDMKNGILKSIGVDKNNTIIQDIHPYTKVKFSGEVLPNFEKLQNLIKFFIN